MPSPQRNQINSVQTIGNSRTIMHSPGAIVGNRYQIIQKLGRDGLGKTYLAKDLRAAGDSRCAIEQIQPQCNNSEAWQKDQQHLAEEVSLWHKLGDHPQIPQFLTYFIENEQFYRVREYIEGESLLVKVSRQVFNEAQGIHLLHDVLRILDFAHKINAIHRNLNPSCIIQRRSDGNFVLVNFGAMSELEAKEAKLIAIEEYGAPEQLAGQPSYISDLYALGKIVIYALTGRSPKELESTNTNWQQNCEISNKLGEIVNKMTAPALKNRYQSALEVLYDLKPLLKIQQVVGSRYRITRYLGGKNGINTYLADNLQRPYQSPCSIKQVDIPDSDPVTWAKIERRLAEELSLLERLGYHDQIPQLLDHFEEQEEFYLVQEYIPGENLEQILKQHKLELNEAIELLENTLSILAFVHQHRVIHRNLKPSNIKLRQSDRAVILIDFGFLNDLKSIPQSTVDNTQPQECNTYLPPEQIAGRPTVSSDLYALGMIIIEAISGVKPENLTRDRDTGAIILPETEIKINRRLVKFLCKMTNLNVGQRYQSVEDTLEDLYKLDLPRSQSAVERLNLPQTRPILSRREQKWVKSIHVAIAVAGSLCLLASIEFAFPTVRPFYYTFQGNRKLSQQPQKALETFMKAIDLQPSSFAAWEGRGDALYRLNKLSQALEAYHEALQLNPKNARNWQKKADILVALQRYHEALTAYDRALQLQPNNETALHQRGKTLYKLQRYPEALETQDRVLELNRLNPQYLSDRAQTLIGLERYYDALTILNRVQAQLPLQPQLWQNKSIALQGLQRPEEANRVVEEVVTIYEQIIRQKPENSAILLDKADFLARARMPQQAIEVYDRAIQIKPNFYHAWLGKAQSLLSSGEYDAAKAAIDEALRIQPQSHVAWQVLGKIHEQYNNLVSAIAAYEGAIQINPHDASVWHDLGMVLSKQNQYTKAIESLTKASQINPQNINYWLDLTAILSATGKNSQALGTINRALAIKPQNPVIWRAKGQILIDNGQYNEACEMYRQSRKVIPDDPAILDSMNLLGCRME
ncbi:MAG: tetratricopeptide repeat protein [Pleurocapsa sp.]